MENNGSKVIGQMEGALQMVNRVYDSQFSCPCIQTLQGGSREPKVLINRIGGGNVERKIVTEYAIRKLTPRECWRLMDFTDEQFDKAQEVNSNTQLYKQAGNSIVVSCLEAIFSQMGIGEKWNDRDFEKEGET